MKIVCDECSAKYSIADEKVRGKVFKIRCKKCSNIIVVRGSSDDAAAAADEAPAQQQPPVDNKETKVFDYAGYDSPQDAMAAAEGGDAIWHVVIDQEQVGPMTVAEIQERFGAGQIDVESYIWKEGFADWQRLGDVPEFAALGAGGAPAAHEDPTAGMFGGPALDDGGGAQSDPADLFASATGGAAADAGSDLFGGAAAGAASAADDGGLFGGAAAEPGGSPVIASESQLRGQRSENSVLFSLNNLASLASDAPKAASPAPAAAPQPGMAGSGGMEGSGLIDIRSMAQVYLGDKGRSSAAPATGSADDLPVFSQTSFESASPVLLPSQAAGGNNKLIYGLVGAIGVLAVAATILVVVVLKGGDEDAAPRVAESAAAGAMGDEAPAAGEGEDEPAPVAAGDDDGSDDTEAAAAAAADDAEGEAAAAAEPAAEPAAPKRAASAERTRTSSRSARNRPRPRKAEPKPEPRKPDPVRQATASSGCDEVTCLVEPDKACCKKYKRGGSRSGGGGGGGGSNSNLPETLTRSDISKGIGKVRGRVTSCGDKHGGSGTVKVKIKIGGDGRVKSANASGGSTALRSCVSSSVKRASFRKTQKGMTVTYPFVFR